MANFQLPNDWVVTATIVVQDAAGDMVPAPAGDVFSVVSNNPASLQAVMGTDADGNPAVVFNALVQVSPGVSMTISDSAGLTVDTVMIDIVQDMMPVAVGLNLATITHVTQPVPANPGP